MKISAHQIPFGSQKLTQTFGLSMSILYKSILYVRFFHVFFLIQQIKFCFHAHVYSSATGSINASLKGIEDKALNFKEPLVYLERQEKITSQIK